jgi:hypothetical protein
MARSPPSLDVVATGGTIAGFDLDWPDYIHESAGKASPYLGRLGGVYHPPYRRPSRAPSGSRAWLDDITRGLPCLLPYKRRVYTVAGAADWARIRLNFAVRPKKGR